MKDRTKRVKTIEDETRYIMRLQQEMSRATPDDQLKFLLNCVKHSNNGKIDFVEVAKECGIVSKGAAAKRYERLMKANGIHPNGGPSDKPPKPSIPKERSKAAIAKAATAKKRKIEGTHDEVFKNDDADGLPFLTKEESKDFMDGHCVKQEPIQILSELPQPTMPPQTPSASETSNFALSNSMAYHQIPSTFQYVLSDGPSIFDEFCNPELFSQRSMEEKPTLHQPRTTQLQEPEAAGAEVEETSKSPRETKETILIID